MRLPLSLKLMPRYLLRVSTLLTPNRWARLAFCVDGKLGEQYSSDLSRLTHCPERLQYHASVCWIIEGALLSILKKRKESSVNRR
jgi:hypothetical protein